MEVSGNGPFVYLEAYMNNAKDKGAVAASETVAPVAQADKVELSPQAKELQEAKHQLEQVPDIRTDKVESLQQAIKDGTYEVNGEKVALKMIRQSLLVDRYL